MKVEVNKKEMDGWMHIYIYIPCCFGVEGLDLWTPKEARLQLALLPSITGAASTQALIAASGSRKVT